MVDELPNAFDDEMGDDFAATRRPVGSPIASSWDSDPSVAPGIAAASSAYRDEGIAEEDAIRARAEASLQQQQAQQPRLFDALFAAFGRCCVAPAASESSAAARRPDAPYTAAGDRRA